MATGSGDVTTWHFDLQVTGGTVSPFTPYKGSIQVWKVYTHA
jgi:surface antigen